jgi:CheY-like chemotaxis protein
MSREVLDQVLEPFFTTKGMGEGSGLGLSMVFGFVKQSGGHMEIDSALGKGTTVSLYLPRAEPGTPAAPAAKELGDSPSAPGAGESILLVEDDADVREMIVTYLRRLGYRVVETSDGQEALGQLKAGQAFDMIVTDVVLPNGMRGPDIVDAAAEISPGLKALYVSGYSQNALSPEGELMEGVHLLTKPFRMKELARKLRDILDA